jgi:hypothetical protein
MHDGTSFRHLPDGPWLDLRREHLERTTEDANAQGDLVSV